MSSSSLSLLFKMGACAHLCIYYRRISKETNTYIYIYVVCITVEKDTGAQLKLSDEL